MKRARQLFLPLIFFPGIFSLAEGCAFADGRPGQVVWSDGHQVEGAISLTPGKKLRVYTSSGQVDLELDEVKEILLKPEKEEMWEGFYFPNVGQTTQVKTGEVYPIRYFLTDITLADGKVIEGHLFTTMLFLETEDATEKVLLQAKQTGANGQKLADLVYPSDIRFEASASSGGSSKIDLTQANLKDIQQMMVVTTPDLAQLPASQEEAKPVWTVPLGDPTQLLFSLQAADGIHVAWPETPTDPAIEQAVGASLKGMFDFYDTRTMLGCFAEADDVYTLVMMKRVAPTYSFSADKIPWGLAILHWKYDATEKKTTLLNRVNLITGRVEGNSPFPTVFKDAGLLRDISAVPATAAQGAHP